MSERDFIFLNCQDRKHDWQHIGGKNAGCGPACDCSVPVKQCTVCKDFDYGDNPEAREIISECAERAELN
jgi:hypothetical protein